MTTKKPIPIRPDITPRIHPEALAPLAEKLPERHRQTAVDLFTALYDAIGKVTEAEVAARPRVREVVQVMSGGSRHATIHRDPTGLEETAGKASAKIVERTRGAIERHARTFRAERDELRKTIDDAFAVESKYGAEVRARLAARSGSSVERAMFVTERINAGDRDTALAVMTAPAWLSGIDDKDAAGLRPHAERRWFGPQLDQVAAVDDVLSRIEAGEVQLMATHDQVLAHVEAARAAQKQQHERMAALAEESA